VLPADIRMIDTSPYPADIDARSGSANRFLRARFCCRTSLLHRFASNGSSLSFQLAEHNWSSRSRADEYEPP
jgi:hypothetical protein